MAAERRRPSAPGAAYALLWLVLVLLFLPIAVMLIGSVRDAGAWTLKWYQQVFADAALMEALANSLGVALGASLLSTVLGAAAAMGLHRAKTSWRWTVEGLSVISLIFPEIVFALSLLSWFFVLGLQLGLMTVLIAHVSFSLSYVMMTVSARLASMDTSLEDAARDLGASEWGVVRTVLLPLLKPAIFGGFVLSFLLSFDDFLITYFVNGVGQDTLPIKLYAAMRMGVSPKLHALSSLMFLFTAALLGVLLRSRVLKSLFGHK
jgi:spermidine/putrescine transport system permease protein